MQLAKAKIIGTNEWVEGYFVKKYGVATIYIPDKRSKDYNFEYYNVDENTYCRDTGATDKNNIKIYENDIVKDTNGKVMTVKWYKEYLKYLFKEFDSNGVLINAYEFEELNNPLEVNGNIFDFR